MFFECPTHCSDECSVQKKTFECPVKYSVNVLPDKYLTCLFNGLLNVLQEELLNVLPSAQLIVQPEEHLNALSNVFF